jgi:hypothetical protein
LAKHHSCSSSTFKGIIIEGSEDDSKADGPMGVNDEGESNEISVK